MREYRGIIVGEYLLDGPHPFDYEGIKDEATPDELAAIEAEEKEIEEYNDNATDDPEGVNLIEYMVKKYQYILERGRKAAGVPAEPEGQEGAK